MDALKNKVRKQELQLVELEEAEAAAADRAAAAAAESDSLRRKMDDVLRGIAASERWRAPGGGPVGCSVY